MEFRAITNREAWDGFSLLESFDYVLNAHENMFQRTLSAGRVRQINACFAQGREYFESARVAGPAVKPTILYYGCLALAMGSVQLNSPAQETLPSNHGLTTLRWNETLARGASGILDVEVALGKGSFSSFVKSMGNGQSVPIFEREIGNRRYHVDYGSAWLQPNAQNLVISLDDLLSRDARFAFLYARLTRRKSKSHVCQPMFGPSAYVLESDHPLPRSRAVPGSIIVHLSHLAEPSVEDIRTWFSLPPDVDISLRPKRAQHSDAGHASFTLKGPGQKAFDHLPVIQANEDTIAVLEDFSTGVRLNDLHRTYLLSFFLGSLARYHPAIWTALQRNEKGSGAQPLLLAAINRIESDFPVLLWEELNL